MATRIETDRADPVRKSVSAPDRPEWLILGGRYQLQSWTAREWAAVPESDRPADAQPLRDGWVVLRHLV